MIDPRGMPFQAWADAVVLEMPTLAYAGRLDNVAAWRDWATNIIGIPGLVGRNLADPMTCETPDDWAELVADDLTEA